MFHFHAAENACPDWARGAEEFCADRADVASYLRRLYLPLRRDDGTLLVALADPSLENRHWIAARYGAVRFAAVSRAALLSEVSRRFETVLTDEALFSLARSRPELSAQHVVSQGQRRGLSAVFALGIFAAILKPLATLAVFVVAMTVLFLIGTFFRLVLSWFGGLPRESVAATRRDDPSLPTYSILVPLYREAEIVPDLVHALLSLLYVRTKLDIKLVVEADDLETVNACERLGSPHGFEVVRVPPCLPRTKPKAVNYALNFARGEYLVIFDAEDRPEPDQLLKSVATFRAATRAVACLQARLAFHNQGRWLTKSFAIDYFTWFGSLLPGLERLNVPMPLGGTSNHFRTAVLHEIGAWDPFNVTEDADIGLRLAQLGYRTEMLDSTTWEEAPERLDVWIKQRSRWLKGYMQTWLVHSRNAQSLVRQVGLGGFLAFQLFIGGAVLSALVNPILWAFFVLSAIFPLSFFGDLSGDTLGYVSAMGAIGSNGLLTCLAVAVPARRGDPKLAPYGLTVVAYWLLISLAAYRGLWHLVTKPFHWEKTIHGLSAVSGDHA
jgi:cellulose synthase/poly-beta-1,6-N-acetylglucosamine synthase-like glycosyltransferase